MNVSHLNRLALFLTLAIVVTALGPVGCQEPAPPQTDLFELAEEHLQRGDYDGATRNYEAFLERYPHSPLAPIAEQRLRNIDRELEAVMGRRSTPAPIYIRPAEPEEEDTESAGQEGQWGRSGP